MDAGALNTTNLFNQTRFIPHRAFCLPAGAVETPVAVVTLQETCHT